MSNTSGAGGRRVLLTVSGSVPADLDEQVASGLRPRADYAVMSKAFGADIVDVDTAVAAFPRLGGLIHRLAGAGPLLAWFCFRRRRRYEVIVTDGEQVGIPLAVLFRLFGRGSARHMMIVHILSTRLKSTLLRLTRCSGMVDRFVVYSSAQERFLLDRLGVDPARVFLTTFMVDTEFFQPSGNPGSPTRIVSAGLERRDYPTLMAAISGLDVDVVIAAASPWSKQADTTAGRTIPDNVTIRRLDLFELRELYAGSRMVVMPLFDVDFQAGITTILEAMAMGLPVVVTRTAGQTDTVQDGTTGVYVPPNDSVALRKAIDALLADREECRRLGRLARQWVVEHADIDTYATRLAGEVELLLEPAAPPAR